MDLMSLRLPSRFHLAVITLSGSLACAVACGAEDNGSPGTSTGGVPTATGGSTSTGGSGGFVSSGGTTTSGGTTGLGASTGSGGTTVTPPYCDSQAKKPLPITVASEFIPSGYFGAHADVTPSACDVDRPMDAVGDCFAFTYEPSEDATDLYAGVIWQDQDQNWGDLPGHCIAEGAKKVTFKARGAEGGEVVNFGAVGVEMGDLELTDEWESYEILIDTVNYNNSGPNGGVVAGFSWGAAKAGMNGEPVYIPDGESITFYIDDIQWVAE